MKLPNYFFVVEEKKIVDKYSDSEFIELMNKIINRENLLYFTALQELVPTYNITIFQLILLIFRNAIMRESVLNKKAVGIIKIRKIDIVSAEKMMDDLIEALKVIEEFFGEGIGVRAGEETDTIHEIYDIVKDKRYENGIIDYALLQKFSVMLYYLIQKRVVAIRKMGNDLS